jgi:ribosomal protein L34
MFFFYLDRVCSRCLLMHCPGSCRAWWFRECSMTAFAPNHHPKDRLFHRSVSIRNKDRRDRRTIRKVTLFPALEARQSWSGFRFRSSTTGGRTVYPKIIRLVHGKYLLTNQRCSGPPRCICNMHRRDCDCRPLSQRTAPSCSPSLRHWGKL